MEAMHGILYEEANFYQFLFISVVLGGAAAWLTGNAVARGWGSRLTLIIYLLLLGWGVRFIHFALFEGSMLSLQFYAVDTIILLVFGLLGFQVARTNQMVTQYYWLYKQESLVSWQKRN